jgi:hypothetical protein
VIQNNCGQVRQPSTKMYVASVWVGYSWHLYDISFFFIPLHLDLTIFKIARLWTVKLMSTLSHTHSCHINPRTQLPYLSTIILNHPIVRLSPNSNNFRTLKWTIEQEEFLKDIKHINHYCHTGALESYHYERLKYLFTIQK